MDGGVNKTNYYRKKQDAKQNKTECIKNTLSIQNQIELFGSIIAEIILSRKVSKKDSEHESKQ